MYKNVSLLIKVSYFIRRECIDRSSSWRAWRICIRSIARRISAPITRCLWRREREMRLVVSRSCGEIGGLIRIHIWRRYELEWSCYLGWKRCYRRMFLVSAVTLNQLYDYEYNNSESNDGCCDCDERWWHDHYEPFWFLTQNSRLNDYRILRWGLRITTLLLLRRYILPIDPQACSLPSRELEEQKPFFSFPMVVKCS